jgi:putative cardiolipin synthase
VDLIRSAQVEINASYYVFGDDEVPLLILSLFREAVRRGVTVRLLVDGGDTNNHIPRAVQAHLVREGVQIREFHPFVASRPAFLAHRMHDKLLIVDGQHLITGGRNMKNDYFGAGNCENFVDRDVYLRGCTARQARDYFLSHWQSVQVRPTRLSRKTPKQSTLPESLLLLHDGENEEAIALAAGLLDEARGPILKHFLLDYDTPRDWSKEAAERPVRFLHSEPGKKKPDRNGIRMDFYQLFRSARRSIVLETPYLLFSDRMMEEMTAVRARGVAVSIVSNSLASTNHISTYGAYDKQKEWMLSQGIELWEYAGPECIHAKAAVIDGRIAVVGSYNFDPLSEYANFEVAVAICSDDVAAELRASIDEHRSRAWLIGPGGIAVGTNTSHPGATEEELDRLQLQRKISPWIRRYL